MAFSPSPHNTPGADNSGDRVVIAHVLHRLYLAGAEVLAADLARQLQHRYDFVFLCLDDVGPLGVQLRGEGFEVINLQRRPGLDMDVALRIRQFSAVHRRFFLHAHQYTPFFYSAVSRGLMGRLRCRPRILFTEHGRHYPDPRKFKRVLVNKFILGGRDRVTAVGHFVKQALVDKEGIRAARIEVIHNGIDHRKYPESEPERARIRAAVRTELGLSDRDLVVLQVARFHPVKDHDTAIRAFAHVVSAFKSQASSLKPHLLLVGDGELRPDAQDLVSELGVADYVRFVGVRGDVPRVMLAADVFMLSSLSEGISVTLLEAMAAAVPIATTDVGGNREVVAECETGLLSPRSDPRKLADNLVTLLRDPKRRRRYGAAGRARLLEMFTQDRMHARFAELYDQIAAEL